MRIYLAGPMTGYPDHNFPAFDAAAAHLTRSGFLPESPADISRKLWAAGVLKSTDQSETARQIYYTHDLQRLLMSNIVLCLPGWWDSRGATLEVLVARQSGRKVYYYDHALPHAQGSAIDAPLHELADLHARVERGERSGYSSLHVEQRTRDLKKLDVPTLAKLVMDLERCNQSERQFKEDAYKEITTLLAPKVVKDDDESVLAVADRLVAGDRQNAYGHPLENFTFIGDLWYAYLCNKYKCKGVINVSAEDVALMMDLLKVAREASGEKRDNRIDGPGYWKCLDLIVQKRKTAA